MPATLNRFHAYMRLFADGKFSYAIIDDFGERLAAGMTIPELAAKFEEEIQMRKLQRNISLSFTPPFDVLISSNVRGHRCLKMSQKSQNEFWDTLKETGNMVQ